MAAVNYLGWGNELSGERSCKIRVLGLALELFYGLDISAVVALPNAAPKLHVDVAPRGIGEKKRAIKEQKRYVG